MARSRGQRKGPSKGSVAYMSRLGSGAPDSFLLDSRRRLWHALVGLPMELFMMRKHDVWEGTLALMVLRTLDVLGPQHGYGIARRIEQISDDVLAVNHGT